MVGWFCQNWWSPEWLWMPWLACGNNCGMLCDVSRGYHKLDVGYGMDSQRAGYDDLERIFGEIESEHAVWLESRRCMVWVVLCLYRGTFLEPPRHSTLYARWVLGTSITLEGYASTASTRFRMVTSVAYSKLIPKSICLWMKLLKNEYSIFN